MEFLNGGDLMYHIQDKGRFELYRATYVRALCEERDFGLSVLPVCPISFFPHPPLEKLESGQSWHWGDLGHWEASSGYGASTGTLGPVFSLGLARTAE